MIGNDIIDLKIADHDAWKRRRYLDKLFHPAEQELIETSESPSICLWQLWSMKESAYKSHFRKRPFRRFNPLKLRCFITDKQTGIVRVEGYSYRTDSSVTSDFIHTTAVDTAKIKKQIQTGIVCSKDASLVRQLVIETLKKRFSQYGKLPVENLIFEKDENRIPSLRDSANSIGAKPCSITHHGDYGAFAILS